MKNPRRSNQSGTALVIVVLALLVITAITAGMFVYSTSETKVDANFRDEQVALFAAKAGLEEARNRILATATSTISGSLPCIVPGASTAVSGCSTNSNYATYITASGVSPWTVGNTANNISTFDSELMCEYGNCVTTPFPNASTCCTSTASLTAFSGPAANPIPYQWVRVNLKPNKTIDATTGTARWVNSAQAATAQVLFDANAGHQCVYGACPSGDTTGTVYELTSYAVTPMGTVRMLQDDVAAYTFNLNFNSPLTMPGTVGSFSGGNSNNYQIDGTDGSGSAPAVPGCTTSAANNGPAVAVSTSGSATVVEGGTPRPGNYTGSSCSYSSSPCVGSASLPTSMNTPAQALQTLQAIEQNANACLGCTGSGGGTYSYSNIVSALPGGSWSNSSDNPEIVYVNGDLDISASSGSGILVVTGNLTYSGNSTWNGIILVVGEGTTTFNVNGGGNGQFDGAIFVATIYNSSGQLLSNYGTADFNVNGGGGSGIFFNSCWINSVQKPTNYLVLSSKEISQ